MKRCTVVLTPSARRDLEGIHAFIAERDSRSKADEVLTHLAETLDSLSSNPGRGTVPQELRSLGVHAIRQVLYKPYRIIYRVGDRQVFVHLIADGRRDMQAVLADRLLRI